MPKSTTSTDRVSEPLAAITKAAEALFRHTSKAVSIRESTTRTTLTIAFYGFPSGIRRHSL